MSIRCNGFSQPKNAAEVDNGKIQNDLLSTSTITTPLPSIPQANSQRIVLKTSKTARPNDRLWKKLQKIICHLLRRPKWTLKDVSRIINIY